MHYLNLQMSKILMINLVALVGGGVAGYLIFRLVRWYTKSYVDGKNLIQRIAIPIFFVTFWTFWYDFQVLGDEASTIHDEIRLLWTSMPLTFGLLTVNTVLGWFERRDRQRVLAAFSRH